MKETIMLFHIEDSRRLSAIRRALLPLKLRVKVISRRNTASRWDIWQAPLISRLYRVPEIPGNFPGR